METIQNLEGGSTNVSEFGYTYNPVGTIATWTQTPGSGSTITNTLTYDNADQLTDAVQSGGGSATNVYSYDPAGNRVSQIASGTTTNGQFNSFNQLTALGSGTNQTVAGHTTSAVTNVTINAVTATLSNSTNFTSSAVPLPAGTNVLSVVAQPSSGSSTTQAFQVVSSGTTPTALTYDYNGNCTQDESGNTYTWDALNRLVSIAYHSGTYSGTHTEFAYDGLNRRVSIIEKSGTTYGSGTASSTKNYLWCGNEICEERNTSNAVTKRFFPQGEQQLVSGTLTPYYYTRDHLGSVREMTDSSGTIQARYDYDPYGRVTTITGTVRSDFQYAGYYTHATSGLNLTLFRAYDPNTARWLSRDPLGEGYDSTLYSYVFNNPINWMDWFGLAPLQSTGKVNVDGDYNYGPPSDHGDTTTQNTLPAGAHANSDLDDYVASTPKARAAGVKIGDPADFTANGKTVHCTVQDSRESSGVEVSRKAAQDAGLTPTNGNGVKLNGSDADIPGTVTYPNTPAPAPPNPRPAPPAVYNPKRG